MPYLAAKHFGLKNFGALYGVLQMALAFGTAFGPLAAGAVFDRYGSYAPFLMLTAVLMGAGGIGASLMLTAGLMAASAIALFSLGPAPSRVGAVSAEVS